MYCNFRPYCKKVEKWNREDAKAAKKIRAKMENLTPLSVFYSKFDVFLENLKIFALLASSR